MATDVDNHSQRKRILQRSPKAGDWGPSWKTTELITNKDQTTASAIHQLRPGHGYFRPFLIRLPPYDSTQCQFSEGEEIRKWREMLGHQLAKSERRHMGAALRLGVGVLCLKLRLVRWRRIGAMGGLVGSRGLHELGVVYVCTGGIRPAATRLVYARMASATSRRRSVYARTAWCSLWSYAYKWALHAATCFLPWELTPPVGFHCAASTRTRMVAHSDELAPRTDDCARQSPSPTTFQWPEPYYVRFWSPYTNTYKFTKGVRQRARVGSQNFLYRERGRREAGGRVGVMQAQDNPISA